MTSTNNISYQNCCLGPQTTGLSSSKDQPYALSTIFTCDSRAKRPLYCATPMSSKEIRKEGCKLLKDDTNQEPTTQKLNFPNQIAMRRCFRTIQRPTPPTTMLMDISSTTEDHQGNFSQRNLFSRTTDRSSEPIPNSK